MREVILMAASLLPPSGQPAGFDLPEPLRSLAAWGFALQRQMNGEMRGHLAALKESASAEAALGLLLAAFLYGVFHAVGPGHGKVVIGGYFATRRAKVLHGVSASILAAAIQALSAIAVVALLAGAAALAPRDVMAHAAWLEVASYGLIAVLGVAMAWRMLRGHQCSHGCSHHHHHHHHGHHHHDHHGEMDRVTLFSLAGAVGFRPCSGAILVLLFTMANGLFALGVAATFAMALGVAITVTGIGLGALGLNRMVERAYGATPWAGHARKALGLAGAAGITLLGLSLLLGALQGGAPQLTG